MQGKESHLVASTDKTTGAGDGGTLPPAEVGTPEWALQELIRLLKASTEIIARMGDKLTITAISKHFKLVNDVQERFGKLLEKVRGGVEILSDEGILALNEARLKDVERAVHTTEGLTPEKKRRWLTMLARTRAIQAKARSNPMAAWAYVGEPHEEARALRFTELDRRVWASMTSPARGRLIQIHPRSGKSLNLVGYVVASIPRNPCLRFLLLFGKKEQAIKSVGLVRRYITSPRFRALYPKIRVLGRTDQSEDKLLRFNVNRPNRGAREYTVEAASSSTDTQGNGYDIIIADDYNPEEVRYQDAQRDRLNQRWFNVIERRVTGDPHVRIFYICTPWHDDDTGGKLKTAIQRGQRPDWEALILKVEDDPETGKAISFCPERFSSEFYESLKHDVNVDYDRLYRLEPVSRKDRIVSRVMYYPCNWGTDIWQKQPEPWRKAAEWRLGRIAKGERWLSADWASSSEAYSSDTAVVDTRLTPEGPLYIQDVTWMPGSAPDLQRFLLKKICGPELFDLRHVPPEAPQEVKDTILERIARDGRVDAGGDVTGVVIDAQGNQKGAVQLFRDGMRQTLHDIMQVRWNGVVEGQNTQGVGGGQHRNKKDRLRGVREKFDGAVLFRGLLYYNERQRKYYVNEPANEDLARLASQVLNPTGSLDGLDALTQLLMYLHHRIHPLRRSIAQAQKEAEAKPEQLTSRQLGMRKLMKQWQADAGRPGNDEMGKELEWTRGFSQQQVA